MCKNGEFCSLGGNLVWTIQTLISISLYIATRKKKQIAHVHQQLDKARAELDAVKLSVEQQKRDLLRASFA